MTDEQIIKALEHCANNGDCKECAINPRKGNYGYCTSLAIKCAVDHLKRLKAENERLQKYNTDVAYKHYNDGIKEFAERLKAYLQCYSYVAPRDIDNLVKEMVGDTE